MKTKMNFRTLRLPSSINLFMALLAIIVIVVCVVTDFTEEALRHKENRDGFKPEFPLKKDHRLKTSLIVKAHKVLQDALQNYLGDVPEANLTVYLQTMRSMREPFRDEFGQDIPAYKKIFAFIAEQVEEVAVENYAVDKFERDCYDMCSVARFLSHQTQYSGRKTIIQEMGKALGKTCPPCIPYKLKQYIEDVVPLLPFMEIVSTDNPSETCIPENYSSNPTTINSLSHNVSETSEVPLPDFSPCSFDSTIKKVICNDLPMTEVHQALNRNATDIEMESLRLTVKLETKARELEEIPKDVIGKYRFRHIYLKCNDGDHRKGVGRRYKSKLRVNAEAFRSSSGFTTSFIIDDCDFRKTNYYFLSGFNNLEEIYLRASVNAKINFATLPATHFSSLVNLSISGPAHDLDDDAFAPSISPSSFEPPPLLARGLVKLHLARLPDFDETALDLFLSWVVKSSENSLEELEVDDIESLMKIPRQIALFNQLKVLRLVADCCDLALPTGSLRFSSPIREIYLRFGSSTRIKPGAFQGDFTETTLVFLFSGHRIVKFESSIYFSLLQQLKRSNGLLKFFNDDIDCSKDVCHLAWIARDHRYLINHIDKETVGLNGTSLQDLDPINGFNHCLI